MFSKQVSFEESFLFLYIYFQLKCLIKLFDMVEKDKFLVVVKILEGRNFPKRPGFQLLAEARFDGELLSSDPVPHIEHPEFTQELAWELNKKALQQHRLQRSSIKVQVFATNPANKAFKENIGYIVLDLRSATTQQTSKWHLLLHGKYKKTKPELYVGLYVDEDKGPAVDPATFKARQAPPRPAGKGGGKSTEALASDIDMRLLKPLLNESEGLYQIGPKDQCSEQFMLSVTISFAMNLPQLIPTSIALPPKGFFFYYALLGNDITSETFTDLLNPNFAAERASVRMRSSVDALRLFFSKQPGLQIHLCCGDQSLGSAEVPLREILKKGSTEIYMQPVILEGAFTLTPPNRLKQQLGQIPEDLKPTVGVSVAVRKEDASQTPGTPRVGSNAPGTHVDEQTQTPKKKSQKPDVRHTPPEKLDRPSSPAKYKTPPNESPQRSHSPSPHDGSYTDIMDSISKTDDNIPSIVKESSPKRVVIQETPEMLGSSRTSTSQPAPNLQQTATLALQQHPIGTDATTTHHYCCSIDLRAVRNTDMPHPTNIFLRYTYAFFGSVAPIVTHPPIAIRKGSEAILPQSFCAFDFATSENQLKDTFRRIPLVIEIWNRDSSRVENTLIGSSKINLCTVLQGERTRAVHTNGTQGSRCVWSEVVPVINTDGKDPQRVGLLQLSITLENWGVLTLPQPPDSSSAPTTTSTTTTTTTSGQPAVTLPPPPTSPRQTLEYKTAMELELWKEQQEGQFDEHLQAKEKQYMLVLAEEWKRRSKDQELVLQKKISAYTTMEEQLKGTLADLTKRERQLTTNEQEVIRLRTDLQREHERKMTEMREASRRLTTECEHRILLERNKIKDLEENIQKYKLQISELETKSQALQKDFAMFREQQNSKPEVRLQSEINLLTLEKVELERKQEALTKSKMHYKQQWGRALKELARLKERKQIMAKQELRRQHQELEHMRLRYLAAEEKDVVNADKLELEGLKKQIQQLQEAEAAKAQQVADLSNTGTLAGEGMPSAGGDCGEENEHITRLIEERDTLLHTGVYTTDDRIISELDRQIREAINRHNRLEATTAIVNRHNGMVDQRPKAMVIR